MKHPLVIALSGGIASGKSAALNAFINLAKAGSLSHFDCDKAAHRYLQAPAVQNAIIRSLGKQVCHPSSGQLDKPRLKTLIFEEDQARNKLESIIHPLIQKEYLAWLDKLRNNSTCRYAICDIPLLFESDFITSHDEIWIVAVSPRTQLKRLLLRDQLPEQLAKAIISAQRPLEHKIAHADRVLWNEGPPKSLKSQAQRLLRSIQ